MERLDFSLLNDLVHNREAGRLIAWLLIASLGMLVVVVTFQIGIALRRQSWQGAWRKTLRDLGIFPFLIGAIMIALLFIRSLLPPVPLNRVVEMCVPLAFGVQAALLLSPDDEPLLEITLASPRPLAWVLAERVVTMAAVLGGIALIGTAITVIRSPEYGSVPDLIVRWLPAALVLCSIGLSFTLAVHSSALSIVMVFILWLLMFFAATAITQMWPILWPVVMYPAPDSDGFTLNRIVVMLIGLALIVRAALLLRDEERLLLNLRKD